MKANTTRAGIYLMKLAIAFILLFYFSKRMFNGLRYNYEEIQNTL
jgi:hypothetical protein